MTILAFVSRLTSSYSERRNDTKSSAYEARTNEASHRVGEYVADYSPVDLDEWLKPDPELEDLLANSRPIPKGSKS